MRSPYSTAPRSAARQRWPFNAGFGRMGAEGGSGFDASAAAYFAAVVAAGGAALDATHKSAVNTFVKALKSAGVWTKCDRLWLLANQHATAAKVDIRNLNTGLAPVNAPTFTADRGYAGNGTTSYLRTNMNLSTDGVTYLRNSAHGSVYVRTNRTTDDAMCDLGGFDGATGMNFYLSFTDGNAYMRVNDASGAVGASATAQGFWVGNRSGASALQYYKNGSSIGSASDASSAVASFEVFIGAFNNAGNPGSLSTDQIAFASVGGSLTSGEVTSFNTAVEALLDALGAGIQ